MPVLEDLSAAAAIGSAQLDLSRTPGLCSTAAAGRLDKRSSNG